MDKFVTQKKISQNEWLWDKYVCPELQQDPRLRIEQRQIKGEVMECVTVLSPMAMRAFTPVSPSGPVRTSHPIATNDAVTSLRREANQEEPRISSDRSIFGSWGTPSSSPPIHPPRWR